MHHYTMTEMLVEPGQRPHELQDHRLIQATLPVSR
jgi:hypothetical protein